MFKYTVLRDAMACDILSQVVCGVEVLGRSALRPRAVSACRGPRRGGWRVIVRGQTSRRVSVTTAAVGSCIRSRSSRVPALDQQVDSGVPAGTRCG